MLERATICGQDIIDCCQHIARFSETSVGITRTFLSPPMRSCHRFLRDWMRTLGMDVTVDAIGNLRGLYPAERSAAHRLIIGSHLDSVPDAGAFDGVLGVVLGIALIDSLHGERLPFEIEVIGFSDEEGVRFGVPFLGSRALIGRIDGKTLESIDRSGISLQKAITGFGLDPSGLKQAVIDERAFAYLEFHIEQGPVLESLNAPLGVVGFIAGQSRWCATFLGTANHAGTTPMHLRRDSLAGAAEWICAVEKDARSIPGLVATVGSVEVTPGASNVIPGSVNASLDVRHRSDPIRLAAVTRLLSAGKSIAGQRRLQFESEPWLNQPAVGLDPSLACALEGAVSQAGCTPHRMISGAGHDAMIMAEKVPSIMLFLRSPGGISHHPSEAVLPEDVDAALSAGLHLLRHLPAPK